MSETRSHLYNQQEVNAIVAEKLEPLLDFGAWGGASSSVSLNRINRPSNLITIRHLGPFFRWMREVPLASTKECRPNSVAFVETPAVMTFGNDLPRRPAIWACGVAVGSGVSVPIMRQASSSSAPRIFPELPAILGCDLGVSNGRWVDQGLSRLSSAIPSFYGTHKGWNSLCWDRDDRGDRCLRPLCGT